MKKVGVVYIFLLFLAGCFDSTKEIDRGMALRSNLLQAASCSFTADITADYADKLHTFSMSCQADQKGNISFTVKEPDEISGITGRISEEGGKLTFDDTALHFSLLADEQISPVSAPWFFLKSLRSGYLRAAGMEDDTLRLTIDDSYDEDAMTVDIWLTEKNIPLRGEILYDGKRILSLTVRDFEIM